MLRDSSIRVVWCETQDDILLDRIVDGGSSVEFVQVKSDTFDQLWSVAKLCDREKRKTADGKSHPMPSILEKHLSHDQGDEKSFFRLVTRRDVNGELSLLKPPFKDRKESDLVKLITDLASLVDNFTSKKGNGVDYWARQMHWDVRESLKAIENSNLIALEEYLNTALKIPLLLQNRRELYRALIEKLRDLAGSRWADGAEKKQITREHLEAWIRDYATRFPCEVHPTQQQELIYLERESIARCEARWRALGVSQNLAEHLAKTPEIGAPEPSLEKLFDKPFGWLVGDFGSGKSLTMERMFQRALLNFRANGSARVPVFLEGLRVAGQNLRKEAEDRASRIGDIATRGVVLFLDGIDGAGIEGAQDLLQQAFVLSRTWTNACVIVSSIQISSLGFKDAEVPMPALDDSSSVALINQISDRDFHSIHFLPHALHSDIHKPLFAVLFGMRLRGTHHTPISIGELLDEVSNKALKPLARNFTDARDLLIRLASLSTDKGGAPVPLLRLANR